MPIRHNCETCAHVEDDGGKYVCMNYECDIYGFNPAFFKTLDKWDCDSWEPDDVSGLLNYSQNY